MSLEVASRRLGGWLFRHRGWLPVPAFLATVVVAEPSGCSLALGLAVGVAGEALRVWAARAIGPASRTRGALPGPLAVAGPYRCTRNPLYIANIAIYVAFSIAASHWVALAVSSFSVPYYALIVRWEEQQLECAHGSAYLDYLRRVPRWIPGRGRATDGSVLTSWRGALRAERGSLTVFVCAFALLAWRWVAS